ncbi:MAG: DUF2207 domain-containing protein [Clostridiales bacterium]|nr:DUF2207 domain-containing protein [Clostridiales bacterium]
MKSQKSVTVVFGIIFAAAVLFFAAIIVFAEVDYSSPQDIDDKMTITEMRVDTVWRTDRSCSVTQELDVLFNEQRHGIYVDIPVDSGERVRGLKVDVTDGRGNAINYEVEHESANRIVRVKVGDADRYLSRGATLNCTLKYDYITPVHPDGDNILDINPVGYGWMCVIENAIVNVTFPTAVTADALYVEVSGQFVSPELSGDGKTVTLQTGRLSPFHGVRVKASMPGGVLKSSGFEGVVIVVVGIVIVVAAVLLMIFLGKDKPLTPVVNFYPPMTDGKNGRKRRMLPTQLGKLIDGKCSDEDVTSLIFYWASEGYIDIEDTGSDTYLIKLKELDPVTEYERTLFNDLFRKGKKVKSKNNDDGEIKKRVSIKDISGSFADNIYTAKAAANAEFREFFKKGFTTLSVAMAFCAALFAVLVSVLVTMRIHTGFFNFIGIITVAPVILAYALGSLLVRTYFKIGDVRRKVFLALFFVAVILLSVAVMFAVPTDAMGWAEKIIFAVCVGVTSALAPFLTRRTDEYTEQLNDIIGFRNFLRDAEKDQLEALLADDPQYYYNILPYANVLGVSDIWQDKFSKLSMQPPGYYHGKHISVFDIYLVSRLSNSIGSSLTYRPAPRSPNIGSFSGGGHSHGGGGGSFGGFGGGGGGSW